MTERDDALTGLEREIGVLMRRARHRLAARAAEVAPDLNPTAYLFLRAIAGRGPLRAAELAEWFVVDKGSTSRLVHQLAEAGLVKRSPDPQDGRASVLTITAEGQHRLDVADKSRRDSFEVFMASWSTAEVTTLTGLLARLNGDPV